jgi:GNAT superfamily N-acetyltransferase
VIDSEAHDHGATVRDAGVEEVPMVRDLTRRAYAEYALMMDPEAWAGLRQAVEDALQDPTAAEVIVAVVDGKLVGSVMLFPPRRATYGGAFDGVPWPEIRLLAVEPAVRGLGVGKRLVRECLSRAARQGATRIGLHTSRSMRAAVAMYVSLGFRRAPEYDFQPPGAELVEAYTLSLSGSEADGAASTGQG